MSLAKVKNERTDDLFRAILELKDIDDCYRFFDDLCTINEVVSLAQRFSVALMLSDGKTYHDISQLTGASTTTIARINRCLNYGENGYSTIIGRLKK